MAFTGRTPESLIPRSDSRNPATTCNGITKSGRPCRRPIDSKASQESGVIAVVSVVDDSEKEEEEVGAAAYFCWQHKDQAERLAQGPETQLFAVRERGSIDTLVERLGVLEVGRPRGGRRAGNGAGAGNRRVRRPGTWDGVEGPFMAVPGDVMAGSKWRDDYHRAPNKKKQGFWASLCCGSADDDFSDAAVLGHNTTNSETTSLLHYIPKTLSPQLAATLLAELSKPISPHDEQGYIYIFWLTPESAGPAPSSAASSLLTPPARPGGGAGGRRTSEVMRQYSEKRGPYRTNKTTDKEKEKEKETIVLKIGRANNVHRRMNEWSKQCGYSLSLVRYYPYVPTTPTPSPGRRQSIPTAQGGVRKVPHAHRVERLIHIELGDQRVIRKCDACGKSHKEWFEVEATREGVKRVDGVVRRWVDWAERGAMGE
ncbi:DUF1766-domain-containing protein [Decorospora gaudefroyi]|uniref:DUF1766-domain-containing protein n=1 Tax=Decorospora gaudefroyi TaxID=184978 RepID=A0A6A5K6B6_9PLEO|nr:DUF1766-domain-containing protein [Decorospora gaudefroyi]